MTDATNDTPTGRQASFGNVAALLAAMKPDTDVPTTVDSGSPEMHYAPLTEGEVESGVWSCTVSGWTEADYPVEEVMVIVSGRLRITDTDGTEHELKRGDIFHLPKGWSGRWDVLEDMQKIYVIIP